MPTTRRRMETRQLPDMGTGRPSLLFHPRRRRRHALPMQPVYPRAKGNGTMELDALNKWITPAGLPVCLVRGEARINTTEARARMRKTTNLQHRRVLELLAELELAYLRIDSLTQIRDNESSHSPPF